LIGDLNPRDLLLLSARPGGCKGAPFEQVRDWDALVDAAEFHGLGPALYRVVRESPGCHPSLTVGALKGGVLKGE
jgi:hypothetical protein